MKAIRSSWLASKYQRTSRISVDRPAIPTNVTTGHRTAVVRTVHNNSGCLQWTMSQPLAVEGFASCSRIMILRKKKPVPGFQSSGLYNVAQLAIPPNVMTEDLSCVGVKTAPSQFGTAKLMDSLAEREFFPSCLRALQNKRLVGKSLMNSPVSVDLDAIHQNAMANRCFVAVTTVQRFSTTKLEKPLVNNE